MLMEAGRNTRYWGRPALDPIGPVAAAPCSTDRTAEEGAMARLLHALGRFCARHGFVVIGVWVLLAVGVGLAVSSVGAQTNNDLSLPGTGSQDAKDLLEEQFPPQQNGVSPIVFHVTTGGLS